MSPKEINRILARVSGKPEEELVETVVLALDDAGPLSAW